MSDRPKRSPKEQFCPKCGCGIIGKFMTQHIGSRVCRKRAEEIRSGKETR
jgi:ribosomal protein S27AE